MKTKMQRCVQCLKNATMGAVILTAILLAACAQSEPLLFKTDVPPSESGQPTMVAADDGEKSDVLEEETDSLAGEDAADEKENEDAPTVRDNMQDDRQNAEEVSVEPEDAHTQTEEPKAAGSLEPVPEVNNTPAPEELPAPESDPEPVPEPMPEPAPAPAPAPAYGAVPFELAAGTGKWWSIDSSDSAYWAMAEQINAVRAVGGLPALAMDGNLSAIASSRCESFVAGGPFDHSGMVTLSEICAAGPLGSASAACAAWQASETHYANIMRTDISSMGVGCWFCDIDGNRYTYWTVTFQ